MASARLPTLFLSHGGGPWPYIPQMRQMFAKTVTELAALPQRLPQKPEAILMISGHWEARIPTVSTSAHPPMEYDYSGFPPHTYQIQYPAPGSPALAARVRALLDTAGIESAENARRGYDHGTFVPVGLMYPDADVPIVSLSMKSNYNPAEHLQIGRALQPLRDEGILIVGSGLTYHNMGGFGRPSSTAPAAAFEAALNDIISDPDPARRAARLIDWESAPAARQAHPREDHLIPLMVAAGAAGDDVGFRVFADKALEVTMASYQFG